MALISRMPAEMFAAVTRRLGGEIRYIRLGRNVVIAWHVKDANR